MHLSWALSEVLIIFRDAAQAIVIPEELEVTIYLAYQILRQGLLCKSSEQVHPVIEISTLIITATHSLIITLDNFDKASHDLRKEYNTDEHKDDSKNHLSGAHWIQISISNCGKSCESKVANDNDLGVDILWTIIFLPIGRHAKRFVMWSVMFSAMGIMQFTMCRITPHIILSRVYLIQSIALNERVFIVNINLRVEVPYNEPPEATNEVGYHEHDDNQSEYLVGIHSNLL